MLTGINSTNITLTGTTTSEINLEGRVLVGVFMPSGISSTTMKISTAPANNGTHVNVYDGLAQYAQPAGDVSFSIAASKYIPIPPELTCGASVIKLIFGSSETAKTFVLSTRAIS